MHSITLAIEQEVDSGVESTNSADAMVYLRISVPELNAQKCLQFHQDDTVWVAKQQILSSIAKTLKDGFNYGLFCPPVQGKAGKFLDEERPLKDYPLPGPIGYLEFKFKRRIYKQIQTNPRKLKQIHTKANLKLMMEAVKKNDVNKVTKLTNGGLDPNFNDRDTGETPLTLAAMTPYSVETIMALVSGGAHLDFRNKESLTPLHTAARKGNEEALRVLLDLGASANYRDCRELMPLYHAICQNASARCVEILLYDHAMVGVVDEYGWTELHQASKAGNVQHLEQLIYYGANMNCQNSSGNTPLHVCAINQKEECARVLLFRGANKEVLNFANQNAFELAIISGNTQLALMIKEFALKDIVPYKEFPTYSDKRRSSIPASTISTLQRSRSNPQLHQLFENLPSRSGHLLVADDSVLTKRSDRKVNRRKTELALVSEFMIDGPFESGSPRSLSISSSGSGHAAEVDLMLNLSSSSSLSKMKTSESLIERTVVIEEGENGFGFILRGAKAPESGVIHLDFLPTPKLPALQYFEQVEPNSPADSVGIRPGDFLLSVNGQDVRAASHGYTVKLIKDSDSVLTLSVLTQKRTTPFSTLTKVGQKTQKNLDRFLMEYETSDRGSICGESYNGSLASGDSASDPNCKIASIRSVHGKRLTPAIPQLEHWAENTGQGGIWKARSAHCLTSATGCLSVLDELEKQNARDQRIGVGASHLSLNQQLSSFPGSYLCAEPEGADDLSENSQSAAKEIIPGNTYAVKRCAPPIPSFQPVSRMLDAPATVEAFLDSSDANPYKIKHSLSICADNSRALSEQRRFQLTSSYVTVESKNVETNGSMQTLKAEREFKVPPPPPPLPSTLPKSVPNIAAQLAGTEKRGGKTRPAVPRRRSQLTDLCIDQQSFSAKTAESPSTGKTLVNESSAVDLDRANGDDSSPSDFLILAEAARLNFLNRKSNDLIASHGPNNSMAFCDQETRSKSVSDESASVSSGAKRMEKVMNVEKFDGESNSSRELFFQEELKNSLSKRRHLENQHEATVGRVDNVIPKVPTGSSEPGFVKQQRFLHEHKIDRILTNGKSSGPNSNGNLSSDGCVIPSPGLLSEETGVNKEVALSTDLSSFIIPPPPLFISGDHSNNANLNQGISSTPVCADKFDLGLLAPPPPPGFEDPPLVTDFSSSEIKKQSSNCRPQNDFTSDVGGCPVEKWSVDEVSEWLETIHMDEHVLNFRQNRVDGSRLVLLGRNELISLGVTQVGQRMKIERAIKKATMINQ